MIARIQQLIVLSLVAIVLGGAAAALALGHPAWAFAAPLVIAGGYATALGFEFRWLHASYPRDSADRPTTKQLLSAWLAEVLVAPRVFLWRQPFRSAAIADSLP